MPNSLVTLFLETPRAGGERGHRWLVPNNAPFPSDSRLAGLAAKISTGGLEVGTLVASREVEQIVRGMARPGMETLVVAGLPNLCPEKKRQIQKLLEDFLNTFDPVSVDWEGQNGLVIGTQLLNDLFTRVSDTVKRSGDTMPPSRTAGSRLRRERLNRTPRHAHRKGILYIGVFVFVLALMWFGAQHTIPDSDPEHGNSDPRWAAFLNLRKDLAPSGQNVEGGPALADARYLWEVVSGKLWTGGDFQQTDMTHDEPRVIQFLECPNPRNWFLDDQFKNSAEASGLRAILEASNPSPDSAVALDSAFLKALNDSIDQLSGPEHAPLESSAQDFLTRQSSRLSEVPKNDRLPWATPADGKRASLLLETISELSRVSPPERRIRSWSDVFSEEIRDKTLIASETSDDPISKVIWPLLKPLANWNSSLKGMDSSR